MDAYCLTGKTLYTIQSIRNNETRLLVGRLKVMLKNHGRNNHNEPENGIDFHW
jgi:hypothetical protein